MNFWAIFQAILGEAEQIVPLFVHNPKSQKIEAILVTTAGAAMTGIAEGLAAQAAKSAVQSPPA
jgi:hypothetical protein